MVVFSLLCVVR